MKCLSFVGRLQLVQSVLLSITNFWCNHFIPPKKVSKIVESRYNAFLCFGKAECPNGVEVKRKIFCLPKVEGGLDLRRVEEWTKQAWLDYSSYYLLVLILYGLPGSINIC